MGLRRKSTLIAIVTALKCNIGDFEEIRSAPDTLIDVHADLGYWPAIPQRQIRYPMSTQFYGIHRM
jgi:hypothetical protein